jgi:hypothetical protein
VVYLVVIPPIITAGIVTPIGVAKNLKEQPQYGRRFFDTQKSAGTRRMDHLDRIKVFDVFYAKPREKMENK